ncbi:ProQ: influences osmotic activation of compatible solute ProP [Halomonas citrativorans]|uniref:ProQ: influences osmotic activation of compatible solute ProP n=1 Tax=Halomonas citrativorans TaxID=2742612 RepID=A0A1R4HQJ8_9GAMM|nr:ProQ: influences osmotic activation of compatible solute ProP [Halomonas citrativorans]
MAASVMQLLDSLESRLEQAQVELQALRRENVQLKEQLATQAVTQQQTPDDSSAPSQKANTDGVHEGTEQVTLAQPTVEPPRPVSANSNPEADVAEALAAHDAQPPSPHALLKEWYKRYPDTFFKGHTKPLKVGIHQDLAAREPWSGKLIRRALANYVNLPRYLKSVREGVERIDLDGQLAGKVDKEAALHAAEKRKAKQKRVEATERVEHTPQGKPLEKKSAHLSIPAITTQTIQAKGEEADKVRQEKPLSMEDKLKDLQQRFKAR